MPPANIVQAEFFHITMLHTSWGAMFEECAERVVDGSPIKTVVRFHDNYGFVTKFVSEATALQRAHNKILDEFQEVGPIRRWFLDRKSRKLARKIIEAGNFARDLAAERVDKVINTNGEIAVECRDRSFRLARGEELYELCMATGKATGVWLFVFQPNDLLADINAPVGHFM